MHPSKNKPRPQKLADSPFARLAKTAMLKAQRSAAKENARFGLPLIIQNSR
jgi:hypothetical protein